MRHIFQATSPIQRIAAGICSLMLAGCGGGNGGGSMSSPNPISVFLPISTVTVSQSGMQVTVPIQIASTSETALVMVGGLPSGVQERYAASDTNPSGTLAFSASKTTPTGTYMPIITVISAGQTVTTTFTLVVKMS